VAGVVVLVAAGAVVGWSVSQSGGGPVCSAGAVKSSLSADVAAVTTTQLSAPPAAFTQVEDTLRQDGSSIMCTAEAKISYSSNGKTWYWSVLIAGGSFSDVDTALAEVAARRGLTNKNGDDTSFVNWDNHDAFGDQITATDAVGVGVLVSAGAAAAR
jgi:hypothetical protein